MDGIDPGHSDQAAEEGAIHEPGNEGGLNEGPIRDNAIHKGRHNRMEAIIKGGGEEERGQQFDNQVLGAEAGAAA